MTLNIPRADNKRVVVIGGGFAGLKLVKKLAKSDYQVVLVDRNNFHMFQPLLYQVASAEINPSDVTFPFRKLFRGKRNVFFRMADVQKIEADSNTIHTDRGSLSYDYLVLATGSTTNYFGMEQIERQAYAMKQVSEAIAIRNRVLLHVEKAVELPDDARRAALLNIVIVGGGATGVEMAGAFAELRNNIMSKDYPEYHKKDINIYLIEGAPRLLPSMSEKTSARTLEILERRGVKVLLNGMVTDYADENVVLKDGRSIPTHNLIWTSGVTVSLPEGMERFERGKGNRLVTDLYFRVKGSNNIFAVGDASIQTDDTIFPNGYPQLARVAIEQAGHLAFNLKRLSKGKFPEKFDYRQYPVLATVGRNHAFVEYKDFRMGGFAAWLAWAGIHLFLILGVKNKLNVFWGWFWNYVTYDLPNRVIIMPEENLLLPASGVKVMIPATEKVAAEPKAVQQQKTTPRRNAKTAKPEAGTNATTGNKPATQKRKASQKEKVTA